MGRFMPTTHLAASGRRRRFAVASLLFLAAPLAAAAVDDGGGPAGPDLPAVILRRFEPATPLETAGSGEAPAVDVRLTVNTEGRVARVEVLRIRPSGEHDEAFRAAVESALAEWRFAPAMQGQAPVEARFDWSLEFRPLEAGGGNHPWGFGGGTSPGGGSTSAGMATSAALTALLRDEQPQRARLLQIFTLPPAQQRRHLERLVALAEEPLSAEARKVADGRLFRVVTDHPGEGFAAAVAGNLDVTFAVLAELLHDSVPLQPPDFKVAVYVYSRREEYLELMSLADGIEESAGYFCPPGLIAFHADRASSLELLTTMIHEAVHAFLFRAVIRPGQALPRWLDEGFADYVGNSDIHKGKLELGRHRSSRFYFTFADVVRGKTVQQVELERVKTEIRKGQALPVAAIFGADRETFYGSEMSRFYAQSWMLVHFLQHGEDGWATERFPRLLLYAAEGYPVVEALREVYGLEPAELEHRYREHVRRF